MPMLGTQVEQASPPHAPDEEYTLRTALSLYEADLCRRAKAHEDLKRDIAAAGGEREYSEVTRAQFAVLGGNRDEIMQQGVERAVELTLEDRKADAADADPGDDDAAEAEAPEPSMPRNRGAYCLYYASTLIVRKWPHRKSKNVFHPVTRETVRMLDPATTRWLHDRAWAALEEAVAHEAEGNS